MLLAILREFMRETLPPGTVCLFGFAIYALAGGRRESIGDSRVDHLFPTLASYGAMVCLGDLLLLQIGEPLVSVIMSGWLRSLSEGFAIPPSQ